MQEGVKVLDLSHFFKNSNLGKIIQTVFLFANILSLVKISSKVDDRPKMVDERPKKTSKRAISWVLNGFPKLGKFLT